MEKVEINNHDLARLLCKIIPPCCAFERDINFFGKTVFHIPPLYKLNPLYEQVVSLRFRALSYLADICGGDITVYCQ
ncbi:MAG: Mo-dependent nitrogenase C-terminal domain-containing protein [Heteroscytonema crispum UTEX LB 1556]